MKLLAKAWEVAGCKNGHPCFIVVRPIPADRKEHNQSDFLALGDNKLQYIAPITCPICTGNVIWYDDGDPQLWVAQRRRNKHNPIEVGDGKTETKG